MAIGVIALIATRLSIPPAGDGLTPVAELGSGDCLLHPGNEGVQERVDTASCSEVRYAEAIGESISGATERCVELFDVYTDTDYWDSDYILGFIVVNDATMYCHAYAGANFAGSISKI